VLSNNSSLTYWFGRWKGLFPLAARQILPVDFSTGDVNTHYPVNKQVLTTRHDITRDQRHNSQCLLSSSAVKNCFHLSLDFVLGCTGYEFYGSN